MGFPTSKILKKVSIVLFSLVTVVALCSCSYSPDRYEKGYDAGYQEGYEEGYEEAYEEAVEYVVDSLKQAAGNEHFMAVDDISDSIRQYYDGDLDPDTFRDLLIYNGDYPVYKYSELLEILLDWYGLN